MLLILFLTLCQCKAQNKITNPNNHPEYDKVAIDSVFEKLDIQIEKVIKAKKKYGTVEPVEHAIDIVDTLSNGTLISINGIIERGLYQEIYPSSGWFTIYKGYYSNGNITFKKLSIKSGYGDFGKLYEFNKEGKLIESINYDKDYKTSFETITQIAGKYAKKYNYKVETAIDAKIIPSTETIGDNIEISREEKQGKRFWYIKFSRSKAGKNGSNIEGHKITIDDETGKVLEKRKFNGYFLPDAMGIDPGADSSD